MPPVGAWSATWLATTLAWIRRPSSTSAIPVSSHEDSIASTSGPLTPTPSDDESRGGVCWAGCAASVGEAASSGAASGGGASSSATRSRAIRSRIAGAASGSVVMISASSWLSL